MGLLGNLFGLGRRAAPADALSPALRRWQAEVVEAAQAGWLLKVDKLLKQMPPVSAPPVALRVIREAVVPVLQACETARDAARALNVESWAYTTLVKQFELPGHYDACLGAMDGPLYRLGLQAAGAMPPVGAPAPRKRLLFFVHNISASLAHVHLLCDLLESWLEAQPQQAADIGIIGAAGPAGAAPRVLQLQERFGVAVRVLQSQPGLSGVLAAADAEMNARAYDQLIFVSVPTGLSYASGRFGPQRLGWLTMKFEGTAFPALRHRYSFTAGVRKAIVKGGVTFLAAPPLMRDPGPLRPSAGGPPPAVQQARRFGTVLYTINREEKIRDEAYLDVVCDLLERFPDTCFVWTGREAPPAVVGAFAARGLQDRQFFAGWVNPDDLVAACDIFLDTPHLSGTVAARAMLHGKPVVTWRDAHAWVNYFQETIALDRTGGRNADVVQRVDELAAQGLALDCDGADAYREQAARLIESSAARAAFGGMLQAVAQRYFLDNLRSAQSHFANLLGEPLPP